LRFLLKDRKCITESFTYIVILDHVWAMHHRPSTRRVYRQCRPNHAEKPHPHVTVSEGVVGFEGFAGYTKL